MSEHSPGPLPIPKVSTTGWAIWVQNTGKHERQWAAFAKRTQAAQYADTCPDFRKHTCKAMFLEPYEPGAPVGQPAIDDHLVEPWDEENREERRRQHAAHDPGAGGMARTRTCAARKNQRRHAQNERE